MNHELDALILSLEDPWKSRYMSLFSGLPTDWGLRWENITTCAGVFTGLQENGFTANLASFKLGEGYCFDCLTPMCCMVPRLHTRALSIREGMRFIAAGVFTPTNAMEWKADSNMLLFPFPERQQDAHWNFLQFLLVHSVVGPMRVVLFHGLEQISY